MTTAYSDAKNLLDIEGRHFSNTQIRGSTRIRMCAKYEIKYLADVHDLQTQSAL